MDRKIIAVLVLAILMASGMVAVMADDSDASTSERVSNNNVYRGEFTIPDWRYYDEYYDPFYYNYLYFIEGSENDQTMERYLRDHNVDVTDDDRDRILEIGRSGGSDQKVKVYEFTEYMSSGIWWGGTGVLCRTGSGGIQSCIVLREVREHPRVHRHQLRGQPGQ